MKTIIATLLATLLFTQSSFAEPAPTMMKIVTRDVSPGIAKDSFASKPKTLYRLGTTHGRLEEMPDPELEIHGLIIVAEPRVWLINLWDKTARMVLDPGPTYIFHAPIVPPENGHQPLPGLELGMEYEYLRANQAAQSREIIQEKPFDRLLLTRDGYTVSMLSHCGEERPWRVTISKGEKIILEVEYDYYRRDLEPQMTLFEPPADIRIVKLDEP